MSNIETIIFLGPSLSLEEARAILPSACFLPPVRCGDVVRCLRLKPKVIVIIDGFTKYLKILFSFNNIKI